MATAAKKEFSLKITGSHIIKFSGVVLAIAALSTQYARGIDCIQKKYVEPVAERVYNKLNQETDKSLDSVAQNQKIIIEMIKIANEKNYPEIKDRAIEIVEGGGKIKK